MVRFRRDRKARDFKMFNRFFGFSLFSADFAFVVSLIVVSLAGAGGSAYVTKQVEMPMLSAAQWDSPLSMLLD